MADLEKEKTHDRRAGRVSPDSPGYSDRLAEDAWIRIEYFRRLTAQETRATLEDSGMQRQAQEPQKIRYSARIQVIEAISQEIFILHRKLATALDRTQDIDIRKLLKALHLRYLGLDIEELCEDRDTGFICELIEKANAYLAKTNLGLRIHLRNRFALLGPEKGYEPIHIVNNLETRKTMHYDGAKIAKPANLASVPDPKQASVKEPSPKAAEEATPGVGKFLSSIRTHEEKLKGGRIKWQEQKRWGQKVGNLDYRMAEAIATACDNNNSDGDDEEGTTIAETADSLYLPADKVAKRINALSLKLKRIGIELSIERVIAMADKLKAAKSGTENYFYRITLFWTASLEPDSGGYDSVEKEGESGGGDEDKDDEEWGEEGEDEVDSNVGAGTAPSSTGEKGGKRGTLSRSAVEEITIEEDPDDIFPAFRNVTFISAVQFNRIIIEELPKISTDERQISKRDAMKLLRSVNACKVDQRLEARIQEWTAKLARHIKSKKRGCISLHQVGRLLSGIEVNPPA